MLKKKRNKDKRAFKANEGAALISVLLVTAMLLLLGSVCLFGSYVNAMMKETDAGTRKNFYALETELDAQRGQLTGFLSEAIESAFLQKLYHYRDDGDEFLFANLFAKALLVNAGFMDFAKTYLGIDLSGLSYDDAFDLIFEWVDDEHTQFRFRSATLGIDTAQTSYNDGHTNVGDLGFGHNYSDITTGFIITVPTFNPIRDGDPTHLKDFILIAAGDVETNNAVTMTGNVYANRILVNSGSLAMSKGAFAMPYNIYLADDLEIKGTGTTTTLSGGYIGMGDDLDNAFKSSALLINGKETNLNLSGITDMIIAGRGFVWYNNNTTHDNDTGVPMGNTLTVKADQLSYLVPSECFDVPGNDYPNPHLVSMEDSFNGWGSAPDVSKLPAEANGWYVRYEPVVLPNGVNDTIVYYFLKFDTDVQARNYFSGLSTIGGGFEDYMDSFTLSGDARFRDLAWVTGTPTLGGANYQGEAARLSKLRVTLDDDAPDTFGAGNPYQFYVKKPATASSSQEFTSPDTAKKAIMINGGAVINGADYVDYAIVAVSGDVIVNGYFQGLLIVGGNVTLNNGAALIEADAADIKALYETGVVKDYGGTLDEAEDDGERLQDYLRFYWRNDDGAMDWDFGNLVNFSGWIKNEKYEK